MNLREAIGEYAVRYAQCQEVIGMEGEGVERIRRQFGEVEQRLCRVVKVAEAAMAYIEHQAASVYDPDDCDLAYAQQSYAQQRGKLWDAFMAARDKAKEVTS